MTEKWRFHDLRDLRVGPHNYRKNSSPTQFYWSAHTATSPLCFLFSFPVLIVLSTPSFHVFWCRVSLACKASHQHKVGLVSKIVFCSLLLSHQRSPLSCCIIYVCHYSSFEPKRHMLSQYCSFCYVTLLFLSRTGGVVWSILIYHGRGYEGWKGCLWCWNGTVN